MSRKLAVESYTGEMALRRSKRTRKTKTVVDSSSGTESVDSD